MLRRDLLAKKEIQSFEFQVLFWQPLILLPTTLMYKGFNVPSLLIFPKFQESLAASTF